MAIFIIHNIIYFLIDQHQVVLFIIFLKPAIYSSFIHLRIIKKFFIRQKALCPKELTRKI